MPQEMIIALFIESALVVLTVLFLTQPRFLFSTESPKVQNLFLIGGFVLLCLTFCWSFVLGSALVIREMHGWL